MSIEFKNIVMPSPEQWKAVIMGTRNPMNSWEKSDSFVNYTGYSYTGYIEPDTNDGIYSNNFVIGQNDLSLMKQLCKAGTDHRKFMRMITIYVDITAPLYWWKEFDTYKVGTVANSCSTMHKIHSKEFEQIDFSWEYLPQHFARGIIDVLNYYRKNYIETKDKKYWYAMIQALPSSYNQKRTVMMNYEVLANIYKSRKNHKLDEWRRFCDWIETLAYSELITGKGIDMNEKANIDNTSRDEKK